jgi:hypothetical protein
LPTVQTLLNSAFAQLNVGNKQFIDWYYHLVETSYTVEQLQRLR